MIIRIDYPGSRTSSMRRTLALSPLRRRLALGCVQDLVYKLVRDQSVLSSDSVMGDEWGAPGPHVARLYPARLWVRTEYTNARRVWDSGVSTLYRTWRLRASSREQAALFCKLLHERVVAGVTSSQRVVRAMGYVQDRSLPTTQHRRPSTNTRTAPYLLNLHSLPPAVDWWA